MSTNVTLTESWVNDDHFQGKNAAVYVFSGSGNTPVGTLSWSGAVLNAIGTYVSSSLIGASSSLIWDGTDLIAGGLSTPYGSEDFNIVLGRTVIGDSAAIELVGHRDGDQETVGLISWHNYLSGAGDKRIAELKVVRDGDDDAGKLLIYLADSDANLDAVYVVTDSQHTWAVAGSDELVLTSAAFYPSTTLGLSLGDNSHDWNGLYVSGAAYIGEDIYMGDNDIHIYQAYGSGHLTFDDPNVAGPIALVDIEAAIAGAVTTWGLENELPFMHVDGDDFEYSANLTWNDTMLMAGTAAAGYTAISRTQGVLCIQEGAAVSHQDATYSNTADHSSYYRAVTRLGGTIASPAAAPTNAQIAREIYFVYDGAGYRDGGRFEVEVDGAISSDNFDVRMQWYLKDGAAAAALVMQLDPDDLHLEVNNVPLSDSTYNLGGSSSQWWLGLYVDTVYIDDTDTYISQDSAGNMIFYDANVGYPVELGEIISGLFDDYGLEGEIPFINDAGDFSYESGFYWNNGNVYLTGTLTVDAINIVDGNTYIREDSAGNMIFEDANLGYPIELSDLVSGVGGYWTRTGTSLHPTTSGDDILLSDSTERILFGDGDTYIYESVDDTLEIYVNSNPSIRFDATTIISYKNVVPGGTTKTKDLGTPSLFWDDLYVDRIYIDDTSTYLDIDSGDLTFTDANSGTIKLADLVAAVEGEAASYTSCTANSTTPIDIGGITDLSFWIHYEAYRDISGNKHASGYILISYDPDEDQIHYGAHMSIGETIGLSLTATSDSADIFLNAIVDNTNGNAVEFSWRIVSKFY